MDDKTSFADALLDLIRHFGIKKLDIVNKHGHNVIIRDNETATTELEFLRGKEGGVIKNPNYNISTTTDSKKE